MSVQACEGVWRQKCGRNVAVQPCDPREGGQRWTDGVLYYADNGTVTFLEGGCAVDLVEYIGPFPVPDKTAEIEQLQSENDRLQTEIERLRVELLQSERRNTADAEAAEYTASLKGLLDNSREALRDLQGDHTELDNRAEGARSAYLDVIKALWEMRR